MAQMSGSRKFLTVLVALASTLAVGAIALLYSGGSEHLPGWSKAFEPAPLSTVHAFLSGKCETCHTPVRGVEARACVACHSTNAVSLGKQSTAFHFAAVNCRGCHAEHRGQARPTRMDHHQLLRSGSIDAVGATGNDPGRFREISDDLRKLLGVQFLSTRDAAKLDCAGCHSNRDPHRGLFGSDCASCHNSSTWRVTDYAHPSPSTKDCAQCHQAPPSHYMEHFSMISQTIAKQEHAKVNECFLCHRTDSFNDVKGVGWYKHH